MDLNTYSGLLLSLAVTISLLANGAAKMLGYRNSLLYGLILAVIAGVFCTMGTCGLPLAESRRDIDKNLLVNLAFGLGCLSGLVSVFQSQDQEPA